MRRPPSTEAEQIGLGDPQMIEQRNDVTGQRLDHHRAAGVGGVPVALGSTAITCPLAAKSSSSWPETEIDSQQAAMEQHDWPPAAVDLVVGGCRPFIGAYVMPGVTVRGPRTHREAPTAARRLRAATSIRT